MTFETVLVAILVAFGFIGTQGLTIKSFIKVPPRPAVHAAAPRYACPDHIARALRAGSHLDPKVFCQKTK